MQKFALLSYKRRILTYVVVNVKIFMYKIYF